MLRDVSNEVAWQQFTRLYLPLVFSYCVKRGLQEADSADVAQEVLRAVLGKIREFEYDPARGSFRGWLFQVTRHKLSKFFTSHYRQSELGNSTELIRLVEQNTPEDDSIWETEYRQRLFDWAVEQVKDEFKEATWQAFWRTATEEASVKETADQLGMSTGAVYIARSRVLARLREVIEQVEDEPWASLDSGGARLNGSSAKCGDQKR